MNIDFHRFDVSLCRATIRRLEPRSETHSSRSGPDAAFTAITRVQSPSGTPPSIPILLRPAEQPDVRTLFAAGLDNASLLHSCLLLVQVKAVSTHLGTIGESNFRLQVGQCLFLLLVVIYASPAPSGQEEAAPEPTLSLDECPAGVPLVDRVAASQLAKITCPRRRLFGQVPRTLIDLNGSVSVIGLLEISDLDPGNRRSEAWWRLHCERVCVGSESRKRPTMGTRSGDCKIV